MKNKVIIWLAIIILLCSYWAYYKYDKSTSFFCMDNLSFSIDNNVQEREDNFMPEYAEDYKDMKDRKVGEITKRVFLSPKENGEGFKIPVNSKVYTIKEQYTGLEQYPNNLILVTPKGATYIVYQYSTRDKGPDDVKLFLELYYNKE